MAQVIYITQIIIACLLIFLILIQAKGSGGLGSAWGSGTQFYGSKRGLEKIIFIATICLATLFLLTSIANTILVSK